MPPGSVLHACCIKAWHSRLRGAEQTIYLRRGVKKFSTDLCKTGLKVGRVAAAALAAFKATPTMV
jgi:hypothetical protein